MKRKIRYPNEEDTAFYDRITKMECTILEKIAIMKKNKSLPVCSHFLQFDQYVQPYNKNANYYDKFWKLYLNTELCKVRVEEIENFLAEVETQIQGIENLMDKRDYQMKKRIKKKSRRKAGDIEKSFPCPYQNCYRIYGSQISLKLHIKLKHNQEYHDYHEQKQENDIFEDEKEPEN